jgi:hypothetical protein
MLFILIILFSNLSLLGSYRETKEDLVEFASHLSALVNAATQSDIDEATRYESLSVGGFAKTDIRISSMQDAAKAGYNCAWCHKQAGGHIEDSIAHTFLHRKTNNALLGCSVCSKPLIKAGVRPHLRTHFPFLMCYNCNAFFDEPGGLKAHSCSK